MGDAGSTDAEALSRRIARATALAWSIGVLALAVLAILVEAQANQQAFDDELRARAAGAYGLGWWDASGRFHGDVLRREETFIDDDLRVTVANRQGAVYGTLEPGFAPLVDAVMRDEGSEAWLDRAGERTLATTDFGEDDRVTGAVIVTGSTAWVGEAIVEFSLIVLVAAAMLIALGLFASQRLARRILRALEAQIQERERILAGAAHELRTPMATLAAVIDASTPDEAPQTLAQVRETVRSTSAMVDRLLTWSRLAHADPQTERVRLDLLVELCLAEDDPIDAESVVIDADPRLIEIAVRNLVENARLHGGGLSQVVVRPGRVEVHDRGPGIADDAVLTPFVKGDASRGTGLGLALVQRIAEKHGGRLAVRPVIALILPVAQPAS